MVRVRLPWIPRYFQISHWNIETINQLQLLVAKEGGAVAACKVKFATAHWIQLIQIRFALCSEH